MRSYYSLFKYCSLLFICQINSIFGQNDSIFIEKNEKGEIFFIQEVNPKQTLFSLSREFRMDIDKIISINPDHQKGLVKNKLIKLEIQKEKLTWLKEHVKIAQSLSWPDTSAKAHLLEVELDRDLLENEILAIESEVEASRSLLRNFTPELNVNDITPVEPLALSLKIGKNLKNMLNQFILVHVKF